MTPRRGRVLSEIEHTPFWRPTLKQRLGAFAIVAVAAEMSVALPPGPTSAFETIISIVLLAATGAALALPWERVPAWATVIVPLTYLGAVLMLILAVGGSTSGVGIIVLIPLIWTALYHRRWESTVVVLAIVIVELVISVTPHVDPSAVIIRRVTFWAILGLVISFSIHGLRERILENFDEREQLHAAQTENLHRMVALEQAAEELAAKLDPQEVVVTAARIASELVSLTGNGLHRAAYVRIADGRVALTAQHDHTGQDVVVSYDISEHPPLEQAVLTAEIRHGPVDVAALGPTVRSMIETLGITHGVYVPVSVDGDVGGALVISMRGMAAPPELVEQCKAVAHLTELALANALSHHRVRELATTDALTGLANRRSFEAMIESRPGRAPFTVVVIDVAGLKEVNDSQGHLAGDALLMKVATVVSSVVRRGDLIARIGGDEFAVLSFDADLPSAEDIAQRMLDALQDAAVGVLTPRASIGIAAGAGSDDAAAVFHAADAAMYEAKKGGGERYAVASAGGR